MSRRSSVKNDVYLTEYATNGEHSGMSRRHSVKNDVYLTEYATDGEPSSPKSLTQVNSTWVSIVRMSASEVY